MIRAQSEYWKIDKAMIDLTVTITVVIHSYQKNDNAIISSAVAISLQYIQTMTLINDLTLSASLLTFYKLI